ncbi:MAG: hypothetical protein MI749_22240 [Desulfovibrionales bacterium]|nr:hypothetical protein [Desulfovibrionales bacterium]
MITALSSTAAIPPVPHPESAQRASLESDSVMQFHNLLVSELFKTSTKVNSLIAAGSPVSLSRCSALEESFWNDVLASVVSQSLPVSLGNSDQAVSDRVNLVSARAADHE